MSEHPLSAGWGMLEGVARTMATSSPRIPSPHPPSRASQRMRALHKHSPGFPASSRQSPWSSNQQKGLIPSELVLSLWLPLLTLQGGCSTCILLFPLSPLRGHSITFLPVLGGCICIFSRLWLHSCRPASFRLCSIAFQ